MSRFDGFSVFPAAALLGLALAGTCAAQSEEGSAPSVAEAARRTREQKKSSKPVRTLTNDNLPAAPAPAATTGNAPPSPAAAPAENSSTVKPDAAAPAAAESADHQARAKAALERAKKELAQAEKDLDLMERKAALDKDAFYSKADFSSDKQGKANLDTQAQQIEGKKQDVAAGKARVAELQAEAGDAPETSADKSKPPQP
jgi:hypothetical protein